MRTGRINTPARNCPVLYATQERRRAGHVQIKFSALPNFWLNAKPMGTVYIVAKPTLAYTRLDGEAHAKIGWL